MSKSEHAATIVGGTYAFMYGTYSRRRLCLSHVCACLAVKDVYVRSFILFVRKGHKAIPLKFKTYVVWHEVLQCDFMQDISSIWSR